MTPLASNYVHPAESDTEDTVCLRQPCFDGRVLNSVAAKYLVQVILAQKITKINSNIQWLGQPNLETKYYFVLFVHKVWGLFLIDMKATKRDLERRVPQRLSKFFN